MTFCLRYAHVYILWDLICTIFIFAICALSLFFMYDNKYEFQNEKKYKIFYDLVHIHPHLYRFSTKIHMIIISCAQIFEL